MILPQGTYRPPIEAGMLCSASEVIELEPGQGVRIDTSPNGEEVLDVVVPEGKHWSLGIVVSVFETRV